MHWCAMQWAEQWCSLLALHRSMQCILRIHDAWWCTAVHKCAAADTLMWYASALSNDAVRWQCIWACTASSSLVMHNDAMQCISMQLMHFMLCSELRNDSVRLQCIWACNASSWLVMHNDALMCYAVSWAMMQFVAMHLSRLSMRNCGMLSILTNICHVRMKIVADHDDFWWCTVMMMMITMIMKIEGEVILA